MTKYIFPFFILIAFFALPISAQEEIEVLEFEDQFWMKENLSVTQYRNGDRIDEAQTAAEWEKCAEEKRGCWCLSGNDSLRGDKSQILYNWFAVNDERGLAPVGFHVPTKREFDDLLYTLQFDHETDPYKALIQGGDSELNFELAGGRLRDGQFVDQKTNGYYWASNKGFGRGSGVCLRILGTYQQTALDFKFRTLGFSVRCLQDEE